METVFEWIRTAAVGVILIPCTISDMKRQEIPLRFVCIMFLTAMTVMGAWTVLGGQSAAEWILSLLPGCFLLVTAVLSHGRIGAGDGLVFLVIGLLIGSRNTILLLFVSLLLSGIRGSYLILRRKAGRNTQMPWMPFVLGGYFIWIISETAEVCKIG